MSGKGAAPYGHRYNHKHAQKHKAEKQKEQ